MTAATTGSNLLFLISQPRAGSTMLQRILGNHPDICTVAEPWLLLYPLYALREKGLKLEFDSSGTHRFALSTFLESIAKDQRPENVYYEGVRRMCGYFYERALSGSGKRYFLDKTPRYYHIIPEIRDVFPDARFIFLLRHPLAVLVSMYRTWAQGNWFWFSQTAKRHDLLTAPRLILEGIRFVGDRGIVVRYEDFVADPAKGLGNVMEFLGLNFTLSMVDYNHQSLPPWPLGDQQKVHLQIRPDPTNADAWKAYIQTPPIWRALRDYLVMLGEDTFEAMGYSYDEALDILARTKPGCLKRLCTRPFAFFLRSNDERPFIERNMVRWMKRTERIHRA